MARHATRGNGIWQIPVGVRDYGASRQGPNLELSFSSILARFLPRRAKVSSHKKRGNAMAPRRAIPQFLNCQFPVTRRDSAASRQG